MTSDSTENARAVFAHMQRMRDHILSGRGVETAWAGKDLTLPQIRALLVLFAIAPCTLKAFAHRSGISGASASQMIDRLVDLGLVDRHQDPDDRRRVVLELTDEARRCTTAHEESVLLRIAELMDMIGPDYAAKWLDVAGEISRVLKRETEDDGHGSNRRIV